MKNLKRNFVWNLIGSTLNSFTSLLFLIFVTRINGIKEAGIFTFCFSTACLLQVIAIYYGRPYQVTEKNDNISNSDYIYNRIFSCILMIICTLLFIIFKKYTLNKIIVLLLLILFKCVEAFSESIYAIIQKNDDLYKVGISLFLKGLIGTILFLIIDLLTNNTKLSIVSLIVTNIFFLIFYDIKNIKEYDYKRTEFDLTKVKLLFKYGFYTFVFMFLTQYVINAPRYAIDSIMTDDNQTIFGIIIMPATLMILISQFMIHPFLTALSSFLKENKMKEFRNVVLKICFAVFIFGMIGVAAAYLIGIQFLQLLYGIKLDKCLIPLVLIIIGATLYGISYIISSALITMRMTKIQSLIFVITSIFAFIISKILVLDVGVLGASVSYLLTMLLLLILYIIYFYIVVKKIVNKEGE